MRVAIVHDWLIGGGAEKVVEQLHALYPDAPIYTSYATREWRRKLDGKVVTGYLQYLGGVRKFLPALRGSWFAGLDLSGYDVVISSSGNGEANHIRVPKGTIHINYCHSPTHFYWTRYDEYIKRPGFGPFNPIARLGLRILVGPLRRRDFKAAQGPDIIVANSTFIQQQIKEHYQRDSVVVHPPVDIDRFAAAAQTQDNSDRFGYVIVGRQVPSKHIDLAVLACKQTRDKLAVVGYGPLNEQLKELAGPNTVFYDKPDDATLTKTVAGANAFLFPCMDDFGIAPVEALAAGTPVIALRAGGALDYVKPGVTGEFFDEQTVESLVAALQSFDPKAYDHTAISKSAHEFSREAFKSQMATLVDEAQKRA